MLAQGLGILGGVGFDVATAAAFGASLHMDAFFVALALPQILVSVLVSNGIRVLSPLFAEAYQLGSEKRLYTVFSGVVNYGILILSGVALTGFLSAPWGINLLAPGLASEGRRIAIQTTRILSLSLVPVAVIEPLRAIHVFNQRLFLATSANFFRYGAALLTLLLLKDDLGIMALSWAYVAGAILQVVVFGTAFLARGGMYRFTFGRDMGVFRLLVIRLGPPVIGELVGQSNVLIERFFASFLSPGVLSALGYGRRMLVALNGLLANSVSVAILPRLSLEAVARSMEGLRQSVVFGTKLIAFITGLVVVLLVGLSRPLVALLFQRGAFDLQAALTTATVLSIFAPSLLFMGITQLFMIPYFALGETRIVMYFRILFLGVNLALSIVLFDLFGGYGLAAALTGSVLIQSLVWMLVLSRRLNGFGDGFYFYLKKLLLVVFLVGGGLYLSSFYWGVVESLQVLLVFSGIAFLMGCFLFGALSIALRLVSVRSLTRVYAEMSARFFIH
jgi:putative peptidoglycan lipid II flippase